VPYPRDLLNSARSLGRAHPATQATLRRAVSTAYYALFHFLVEEACANWVRPEQRHALARTFIHKHMFDVSNGRIRQYKNATQGSAESQLYSVADASSRLQQERHKADYDMSNTLSAADVELAINLTAEAFEPWHAIRNEQIAQDYLFSLLFKERA
jgi:uncharacterized protein (UPF0332 family)